MQESKLMTAEQCAIHIFYGIAKRKRTLIMTVQGKLLVWVNKWFAAFADKLVYKHFLNEPNSPLQNYK